MATHLHPRSPCIAAVSSIRSFVVAAPPRERPLRFTTSVSLGEQGSVALGERRSISAVTPTGIVNRVLFHEGVHGYTGAIDPSLHDAFGYRAFNDPRA
jgi:hypothetical protein